MTKTLLSSTTFEDVLEQANNKNANYKLDEVGGCRFLSYIEDDIIIMDNTEGRGVIMIEGAYQETLQKGDD